MVYQTEKVGKKKKKKPERARYQNVTLTAQTTRVQVRAPQRTIQTDRQLRDQADKERNEIRSDASGLFCRRSRDSYYYCSWANGLAASGSNAHRAAALFVESLIGWRGPDVSPQPSDGHLTVS